MLNISNLSIHFGGKYIFDSISFNVQNSSRVGLIGRNGTGKTTLLKIIAGLESPESGTVSKPNDYTIGYLPQEGNIFSDKTIIEETRSVLTEFNDIEKTIKLLTDELDQRTDYESVEYLDITSRISLLSERFSILGGYKIDAEVEKILTGLGFERNEFDRKVGELSGGWQMRIELGKILLRRPDCILLDEPTNHLDIDSIQWLENFLLNYPGCLILVSHDRNFLNKVSNRTIEIAFGKIFDMNVSYNEFINLREEQKRQNQAQYKSQQKQIKETEKFIERFRSKATLATRVQSRIKQLEKLDVIELDEEDPSAINVRFPEAPRSSRLVAGTKNLSKSYGEKLVLDNIDFEIERGERIAFVGKNGEGKTTFSKILAGKEDYGGILNYGYNIKIGYFSQNQAELLNGDENVFEVIDNAATGEMRPRVRSLLGAFLFSGDSVYKKVKVLSGGEKSRLALAKLLLEPVNFLLLDEPTNHLDMVSKDVLKRALTEFDGALIIVSHDRDFLNGLTNKTVHFKDHHIKEYLGGIYEFLEKQKLLALNELESRNNLSADSESATQSGPGKDKLAREQMKNYKREESKILKQITLCENDISQIENKIADIENLFSQADFFANQDKSKITQIEYESLRAGLTVKMDEWMVLHEQLEELKKSD